MDDPREDRVLNMKMNQGAGFAEFNRKAARFKRDLEDLAEPRGNWQSIVKLVDNKDVKARVFARKEEYA